MNAHIISVKCGGDGPVLPMGYFMNVSLSGESGKTATFAEPPGYGATAVTWIDNHDNRMTPCEAYQAGLELKNDEKFYHQGDVLIYVHDDVTIHDSDWLARVLEPFARPNCVTVGLGGALSLGHPDLYKRAYRLQDMARGGYRSNQTDWQTHGERETGSCRVAVVDAFFMAVRRDFLLKIGGWPVRHLTHHCLDLWLACEAARHRKETWMVGVGCTHHGGGSSTKTAYREAKWLQGGSLEQDHQQPHRWLYDSYRDCLPFQVKA